MLLPSPPDANSRYHPRKMKMKGSTKPRFIRNIIRRYCKSHKPSSSFAQMGGEPKWNTEQIKCLLDICLEEINRLGRRGGSIHKESWAKLGKALKERFNLDLTQKQMKNGYDTLKSKYLGYVYLRNKTGNIYNPETKMFSLTAGEWDDFKKVHPRASSLRTAPMPYPELCAALFDGRSASGNNRWPSTTQATSGGTSSSTHHVQIGTSSAHHDQILGIEDNPFNDLEDDDGTSAPKATRDVPPPSNQEEPSASRGRPSKKAKTSNDLDELAHDMQKALKYLVGGPTVAECHEKLKLTGLIPTHPLFLAAFNIFGQSIHMREAWMELPAEPEVLKGWLKLTSQQSGIFRPNQFG